MAKENRIVILDHVFKHEGGYAERPEEGGGAVNMGITFTVFQAWRAKKGQPDVTWADLKAMSRSEAEEIYVAQFLTPIHFDDLPTGVDYCVYDCSVNSGVSGSLKILQQALGLRPVNGKWDDRLRWAVNHRPVSQLIKDLCRTRLEKYQTYKIWHKAANKKGKTWGQIWTDRVNTVEARALAMAEAVEPQGDLI